MIKLNNKITKIRIFKKIQRMCSKVKVNLCNKWEGWRYKVLRIREKTLHLGLSSKKIRGISYLSLLLREESSYHRDFWEWILLYGTGRREQKQEYGNKLKVGIRRCTESRSTCASKCRALFTTVFDLFIFWRIISF